MYTCPLCGQPVSKSQWQKITGIWETKQKELSKIKVERQALRKKEEQFKLKKAQMLKDIAAKEAKKYKIKFDELRRKEGKIKADADKKVANTIAIATHNPALTSDINILSIMVAILGVLYVVYEVHQAYQKRGYIGLGILLTGFLGMLFLVIGNGQGTAYPCIFLLIVGVIVCKYYEGDAPKDWMSSSY